MSEWVWAFVAVVIVAFVLLTSEKARAEAAERRLDDLYAAIVVCEANWDTGGNLWPDTTMCETWYRLRSFIPPEKRQLPWAVQHEAAAREGGRGPSA